VLFNGRAWTYDYSAVPNRSSKSGFSSLSQVTLPEGLTWSFSYSPTSTPFALQFGPALSKVKLPTDAVVDYTYYRPDQQRGDILRQRVLSGPNLVSRTWVYTKTITTDFETTMVNAPHRNETYTFYRGFFNFKDSYLYKSPRNPYVLELPKSMTIADLSGNIFANHGI